jgi:predicted ATPase
LAAPGKTRLALQAAAELVGAYPLGAYFVTLTPLSDPGLVLPTIARTFGVADTAGGPVAEAIGEYLAGRRVLLVLDNFEHVLQATPGVGALLAAAPGLTVLATSRIPLHLAAEHEYAVPPLAMPDPGHLPEAASLGQYDAILLFLERARAVRTEFEVTTANARAIAELCARLDRLPLAIRTRGCAIKTSRAHCAPGSP